MHFKKEFDTASLEIKAVIVNEILTNGKNNREDSFKVVSAKLFEGAGELGKVGSGFLHSHIATRPNSEKTFYLVAMMAKIPALSGSQLKKAAAFVAFADKDVSSGFRKALKEDKSVGFAKRMMLSLAPMDFIPRNSKKMLIKAVSKHFLLDYVSKKVLGVQFEPKAKVSEKINTF